MPYFGLGLGWSEPQLGAAVVPSALAATHPRLICAVSPSDDWIASGCSCVQATGPRSCQTTSGNQGTLYFCPPGCPSVEAGGGVSTVTDATREAKTAVTQPLEPAQQQPSGSSAMILAMLAAGSVGLVVVGGLAYWFYRRSQRRIELEQTLLSLSEVS